MKTILVPTDLGPRTHLALSVAADIARASGASIQLLHSVEYPMAVAPAFPEIAVPPIDYGELEATAQERLNQLVTDVRYLDVSITPVLLGNGQGLVDTVTNQPADLIVMSSQGASGLAEWLVGSNAEAIVRYAHGPVLVVKEPVAHFQPERVVCAVDLDERLETHFEYPFPGGKQRLSHFLYVMTPTDNRDPEGVREWVQTFARAQGLTPFDFTVHWATTVPKGINQYAEEVHADLIVVFTHGRKGLRHLLAGSVAEDVLNHATVPVLVMRL